MGRSTRSTILPTLVAAIVLVAGVHFVFEAVQGQYGLFARLDAQTEIERLTRERDALQAEIDRMENLTLRLSDQYLDLDLLDEQARAVLGMVRHDEVVLR